MIYEKWKDVPGYEGLYQISDFGRLKSYKTSRDGKILQVKNRKNDYLRVVLQGKGKPRKSISVHRLVAEAFIPNKNGHPCVNHKDGDKQNNHVENLEWCTQRENVIHSINLHPMQTSAMIRYNTEIRPLSVLQITKDGEIIGRFRNAADASRETGICARNILQAAHRADNGRGYKRKSAGGYLWRFEKEVSICEL